MIKKERHSVSVPFFFVYINDATVSTNSTTLSAVFLTAFLAFILLDFVELISAAAEHTAIVAPIIFITFAVVFFLINNTSCTYRAVILSAKARTIK